MRFSVSVKQLSDSPNDWVGCIDGEPNHSYRSDAGAAMRGAVAHKLREIADALTTGTMRLGDEPLTLTFTIEPAGSKAQTAEVDPRVVGVIDYIVGASERESLFATPDPQYYLGTMGLIDEIVRLFGIDKTEMSRLVDLANDKAGKS